MVQSAIQRILVPVFCFSGATAIIYEIVWSRHLQILFGSTVYTSSTIFASFLFGFACGSYLARSVSGTQVQVFKLIGRMQLLIGGYGLFSAFFFSGVASLPFLLKLPLAARAALCAAFVMPPAMVFGAMWPVVSNCYVKSLSSLGRDSGRLYSSNSVGSGLGAIAGGFILIPWLGFRSTSLVAAALNACAGVVLLRMAGRSPR